MFEPLKSRNSRESHWENRPNADHFNHSPGTTSFQVKGNEASRMVRCRVCGFPCDKERDSRAKSDSWAGIGVNQGELLTAGTSIGDARVPAAGTVNTKPDSYYSRTIVGGCPCCATWDYDK